jgi:chromosome partitioning protein
MFPEADSSRGLAHQLMAIEKVKKYLNPKLCFLGCMIVKYDRYNATHLKFEKLIREYGKENGVPVFKTNVPNSQSVAAAAACGLPLAYYKPKSQVAQAYIKIAKEVLALTLKSDLKSSQIKRKHMASDEIEIAVEI